MRTGDIYRHYKGGVYIISCISKLESDTDVDLVTYIDEDGIYWTMLTSEFLGGVIHNGKYIRRFAVLK